MEMVCCSLNEFNSAFRTKTLFEVAVPSSFSAKHWYCPRSSSRGFVTTKVPRPGCWEIRSSYACHANGLPFLIHRYVGAGSLSASHSIMKGLSTSLELCFT